MGIFDFFKRSGASPSQPDETDFSRIVKRVSAEIHRPGQSYWTTPPVESDAYKNGLLALPDKQKIAFVDAAMRHISSFYREGRSYSSNEKGWRLTGVWNNLMSNLLKTKIQMDEEDVDCLAHTLVSCRYQQNARHVLDWPVGLVVTQVERQWKEQPASAKLQQALNKLRSAVQEPANPLHEKEQAKILARLDILLHKASGNADQVIPLWFPGQDDFATHANESIKQAPAAEQAYWFRLMAIARKASGSKPSKKMLDECKGLFKELGTEKFKAQLNDWFQFIIQLKETSIAYSEKIGNQMHDFDIPLLLAASNIDIIKSFVWMCVHFHDKATLFTIANLAERCYRKIPGKGPAAPVLGNACLYVLANSKGLDGVGHISRLKSRVKHSSIQAMIDKYLNEAASGQGVTVHEIEDLAVDDHGLVAGRREYTFDGYRAVLEITGIGKTNLQWYKPDGSEQKSIPALVKEQHAGKLKKIKDTVKQIELTLTAQRDRLDRMLKTDRQLAWSQFNSLYIQHGLMSFIAKRLIWMFTTGNKTETAFYINEQWVNNSGEKITEPAEDTTVSLWHPVFSAMDEVRQWREFMMQHTIVQPLKQAFREVYLLTDAEINTRTYSNRMAAHILKQHQFNSLAQTRGWKYKLSGAFDSGEDPKATVTLKDHNLRAEYWLNDVHVDNGFADSGIALYMATDQVRFVNTTTNEIVELIEIPRVIFSEVMRDVDLFVGVASVGNDPAWRDSGGVPAYRDYWQSYSFGELTEVAKTRKTILQRLVPRLKIGKVAEIKDRYLVIKGKIRTYKIHLGSTNILMEPNDEYLCIVPDRSLKTNTDLFLPFEGDSGLSIIISKALLLAEDDKITDETITRQIKR